MNEQPVPTNHYAKIFTCPNTQSHSLGRWWTSQAGRMVWCHDCRKYVELIINPVYEKPTPPRHAINCECYKCTYTGDYAHAFTPASEY